MKSGKKPKFGFAISGIENPETKKLDEILKKNSAINPYNGEYLIFLSFVESLDLGVVGWVLGNKAEDGFGCGGWRLGSCLG